MNFFRILLEFFLVYLLYKLIFDFVIPIYQSTGKIKRQFSEMQNRMQQDINAAKTRAEPVKKEGDYIDFEEIKK